MNRKLITEEYKNRIQELAGLDKQVIKGDVVAEYYKKLGTREMFDDDLYEQILINDYILKKMDISSIVERDIDLKHFVNNELNQSDGVVHNKTPEFFPVILGKNSKVLDGYHRITQLLRNGITKVDAYLPVEY